ncbi:MAG: M20/M25/M40 family metallo-hydrolase [Candidatus Magasanikbacteria bacterium]|nr:M20/M25/M40 family metallo-hydrolase [Candidatus Magasanikbacteria bacterium]
MINTERLVNTFLEIVRIDSPSGEEGEMVVDIIKRLDDLNIKYEKDSFGNVIAHTDGDGEPIVLAVHLDTVEPGRGIEPIVENGLIKSRGKTILGADNKNAVAAVLEILQVIKENNLIAKPLDLVFTLSEETANWGAVNLDYSMLRAKSGFSFDSSNPIGGIIIGSPFYYRFDIKILGRANHASVPEKAVNALNIFHEALKEITLGRVDNDTICNIGTLEGGHVRNTIPGELVLKGEVRSFYEEKARSNTDKIIDIFDLKAKLFGGNIEYKTLQENPGFIFGENDELVVRAKKIMDEMNISSKTMKVYGCFDANIFYDKGIKILNLADGSKYSHSMEEELKVSDLENLAKIALNLALHN